MRPGRSHAVMIVFILQNKFELKLLEKRACRNVRHEFIYLAANYHDFTGSASTNAADRRGSREGSEASADKIAWICQIVR